MSLKAVLVVSRCAWTLYNFRLDLMRELQNQGYRVICAGDLEGDFALKLTDAGFDFRQLPVSRRAVSPIGDLHLLVSLLRLIRLERPAVVHNFTIKPVIYGSIAARIARVPRVVNTVTGLGYAFTGGRSLMRRIASYMYRFALRGSHHTFFQNRDDMTLFVDRRLVSPERASLIAGSGVDMQRFAPRPLPPVEAGLHFLLVSRLLIDKGIREFLEATRVVKQRVGDRAHFAILGDHDTRNPSVVPIVEIDSWQQEGIGRWLGQQGDVVPYLASAHVVVLPSYREGLPRSMIEAAAMGRPAITTDVPGCREVVENGKTGLVIAAANSSALANAMLKYVDNPELVIEHGRNASQVARKRFDSRAIVQATLEEYEPLKGSAPLSGCYLCRGTIAGFLQNKHVAGTSQQPCQDASSLEWQSSAEKIASRIE